MKKLLILALVLFASVAFAAAEDMTFKGWVSDEACAKDFAKAGNAMTRASARMTAANRPFTRPSIESDPPACTSRSACRPGRTTGPS